MTNHYEEYHSQSNWPPMSKPEINLNDINNTHSANAIHLEYEDIDKSLMESLELRTSSKQVFIGKAVDKLKLGTLLKWSVGKRNEKRMYPSAGALYKLKILVVIKNVERVKTGIYEYNAGNHSIVWLSEYREFLNAFVQDGIDFNLCFILGTNFDEVNQHYGERGYRFSLLEAGHIMQNMNLVASSLNLGIAPIGGFIDDAANERIPLINFKTIYLVPVGEQMK